MFFQATAWATQGNKLNRKLLTGFARLLGATPFVLSTMLRSAESEFGLVRPLFWWGIVQIVYSQTIIPQFEETMNGRAKLSTTAQTEKI